MNIWDLSDLYPETTPGYDRGSHSADYGVSNMQSLMSGPPTIPEEEYEKKNPYAKPGDVSGFANYGMQAPDLGDPMAQLKGLMGMAPQQAPQQQMPQGGLMAYLQALSRI